MFLLHQRRPIKIFFFTSRREISRFNCLRSEKNSSRKGISLLLMNINSIRKSAEEIEERVKKAEKILAEKLASGELASAR